MGIYRKGKSWYFNFYYQGQRYQECIGPVNKTIAKEVLAKRKAEVIEGRYNLNQKKLTPLFENFCQQYLETYSKPNKKPSSYLRDQCSIKRLGEFFTGKRLADISAWLIEKYRAKRKEEGATVATLNRELACLRHMLNMARKWKKLNDSPFKEVKLQRENNEKMRILTQEEEITLMNVIKASPKARHLGPIVITALNTGMRKGEILGLKWSAVTFKEGYIVLENTKNNGRKIIPMNNKLTDTLKNVKKDLTSDYVFANGDGLPYRDIKTGWWNAIKKIGLTGLRFHDLRHTFASRLVMAGIDLVTVKELLGYKDIKMTMRYSHPAPEHKKAAVKILDEVTTILTTQQENKVLPFTKSLDR